MWMEVIWIGYKGDLCSPTAQAVPTHWPQLEARWESGCHRQRGRVSERPGSTFLITNQQPVESWEGPTVHWQCTVLRLQKNGLVSVWTVSLCWLGHILSLWLGVTLKHPKPHRFTVRIKRRCRLFQSCDTMAVVYLQLIIILLFLHRSHFLQNPFKGREIHQLIESNHVLFLQYIEFVKLFFSIFECFYVAGFYQQMSDHMLSAVGVLMCIRLPVWSCCAASSNTTRSSTHCGGITTTALHLSYTASWPRAPATPSSMCMISAPL